MDSLFTEFFSLTLEPSQRLYWPFVLSSVLVAFLYSYKDGYRERWREIVHPSSQTDAKIFFLNLLLKTFIFPLFLFSTFSVSVGLLKALRSVFEGSPGLAWLPWQQSLVATILAFVLNDFFRFLQHYLMHQLPGLRLLHRTHHSALVLTPLTLFRTHPIEALIAGARNVLSMGITFALYSFLFERVVNVYDFLGVNLFGFLFNAALSNLRHSPIPFSFGPLEYFIISPRMHQIHHSNNPKHWNKNYGVALSLWDQLMGSFYRPTSTEAKNLSFGLHLENSLEAFEEATTLKGVLIPRELLKGNPDTRELNLLNS